MGCKFCGGRGGWIDGDEGQFVSCHCPVGMRMTRSQGEAPAPDDSHDERKGKDDVSARHINDMLGWMD